jgi:hypothetical protein
LKLLDNGLSLNILFDVNELIVDALLPQKFLAALAITAPIGAVEFDIGMRHYTCLLSRE